MCPMLLPTRAHSPLFAGALLALASCATVLGLDEPLPTSTRDGSTQAETGTPGDAGQDGGTLDGSRGPFCQSKDGGFCDDFQNGVIQSAWIAEGNVADGGPKVVWVSEGATQAGAMKVSTGAFVHVDVPRANHVEFSFSATAPDSGSISHIADLRLGACKLLAVPEPTGRIKVSISSAGVDTFAMSVSCVPASWHRFTFSVSPTDAVVDCDGNFARVSTSCPETTTQGAIYFAGANEMETLIDDVHVY
jgi:hypothetical protein